MPRSTTSPASWWTKRYPMAEPANTMPKIEIAIENERMLLDPRGTAYSQRHQTLIVADLHLEKGSAFARRGTLLPPYDTITTLRRLASVVDEYRPQRIVSLGDGFHDTAGARLITGEAADLLEELAARTTWIWVRGNHDEHLPSALPGQKVDELRLDNLLLRHVPERSLPGLIAGHLHPKARIAGRHRRISRPCFVHDEHRLIMPAFGSYTGGLNVLDPAISGLFANGFTPRLLGEQRLHRPDPRQLVPEPPDWRRHRL